MALASLATGVPVHAQQAGQTEQDTTTSSPASAPTTVRVVGTRQAQESAIGRKKKADTAQDSIVAEDVGAFPDRNVADAISRIAGVAVDRGDYGEGISVSIRGNGPELTRVELDGQGVQSAGGADLLGGMNAGSDQAGGRAVEMRQLSSDLIKSVDVVKGSTADMVEGSLGGSVRITTRNGLDFKKDYLSMRVAGMQNTLNEKLNPNLNLVGVKKLMNDRLGVLVNLSRSKVAQESHSINQGGSSSAVGAYRPLDFDNSPEKTFSFQPNTVKLDDPLSTTPLLTSNLIGGGTFNAATPQEIVAKSAAAQTKAACYQAFPLLTEAQANAIVAGATRTSAINQRQTELLSCLGQWNDYVPSSTRYFVNRQDEDRNSGDIRLDFKVSEGLQVYVKHSRSSRHIVSEASSAGYGGPAFNVNSVTGPNGYIGPSFTDTVSPTQLPNGAWATRNLVPASGYFLYPDLSWRAGGAANGSTSNIDPNSVTVDANHHLTWLYDCRWQFRCRKHHAQYSGKIALHPGWRHLQESLRIRRAAAGRCAQRLLALRAPRRPERLYGARPGKPVIERYLGLQAERELRSQQSQQLLRAAAAACARRFRRQCIRPGDARLYLGPATADRSGKDAFAAECAHQRTDRAHRETRCGLQHQRLHQRLSAAIQDRIQPPQERLLGLGHRRHDRPGTPGRLGNARLYSRHLRPQ